MRQTQDRTLLDLSPPDTSQGPVKCLGLQFPSEEARRAHFAERLRETLEGSSCRQADGFPVGADDDILALSDPPYFTLCPNPFLGEMIEHYGRRYAPDESYRCKPFAADVAAGKNDTIYMAHSYHTKVPHQAILRYILHYTKPGDIVLDGFCGSGMTGVAAALCADASPDMKAAVERDMPGVEWGRRIAILNDLSPAAAFIAHNYNARVDVQGFLDEAQALLGTVERECGHLYRTAHHGDRTKQLVGNQRQAGVINFTVWSEVNSCPQCGQQLVFFEHAVEPHGDDFEMRDDFP